MTDACDPVLFFGISNQQLKIGAAVLKTGPHRDDKAVLVGYIIRDLRFIEDDHANRFFGPLQNPHQIPGIEYWDGFES